MTPEDLNFPHHIVALRSAQREAFSEFLESSKRFDCMGLPPGAGKSGISWGVSQLLSPNRAIILTADKSLLDQYTSEYDETRMIEMRGRANFHCWEGNNFSCEDGARLGCKEREGCPYLQQKKRFDVAQCGVTNYAWWIAANKTPNPPSRPDILICDEAHLIFEWLSRALDFLLTSKELKEFGILGSPIMPGIKLPQGLDEWKAIGESLLFAAAQELEECKIRVKKLDTDHSRDKLKRCDALVDKLWKLDNMVTCAEWVGWSEEGRDDGRAAHFCCVWPFKYREWVFQHVEKILLMSATLRPKTLSLIGISDSEYMFREWPRQFPIVNGPVTWVKTVRVNANMTEENKLKWLNRHAEIARWGSDRNGIVHSVSYPRAKEIAQFFTGQGMGHRIVLNGSADPESQTARQSYERFITKTDGLFISPSLTTGWDFKYKRAEYQIISKIAIPDSRGPVMKRRQDDDKTFPFYLAAQSFVQACGRINRAEDDLGQTLLIDDSWVWFRGAAKPYMPYWFKVRESESLPTPLRKLT